MYNYKKRYQMKNPITWGYASLLNRGLTRTVSSAVHFIDNWLFDLRYGTDTAWKVDIASLDIPLPDKAFAHEYGAAKAVPTRNLMDAANLPEQKVFIDMGCGKGKALLIAAAYGCQKVIGVELSPTLCERARANLHARLKNQPEIVFEVIQSDAAQFEFRDDENVIYFQNPFAAPIIRAVLRSLERSLQRVPRPVWILFSVAQFRASFEECPFLELKSEHIFAGCENLIFTNSHYLPS